MAEASKLSVYGVAIETWMKAAALFLSVRLLETTKTISEREMKDQALDSMDLERERGITIVSKNVSVIYKGTKINIIEYNPISEADFKSAEADTIDKFANHLIQGGIPTSVRRSRGKDIDAACGQLANKSKVS